MAPSRHDWKIVDWDVKPQHNQPILWFYLVYFMSEFLPIPNAKMAYILPVLIIFS